MTGEDPRHPIAVVYGGGGVYGIAYGLGIAHGLRDAGIDLTHAPALGTSAGSWVASMMALGLPEEAVLALEAPSVPTRDPVLIERARTLFGDARHRLVRASALYLRSGRRHVLEGADHDLADIVAASSAVPALFPPHRIDGRLYVDGGMWSATSVDAAAEARHVIVIAPLASTVAGPIGRGAGILLRRELRSWRRRHPGATVSLIEPVPDIARLAGRTPLGLFDGERAPTVYQLARAQGASWGERNAGIVLESA